MRLYSSPSPQGRIKGGGRLKKAIIIIVITIAGLGLLSYPIMANYLFVKHASTATQEFDNMIDRIDEETLDKAMSDAAEYNDHLEGYPERDAFVASNDTVMSETYKNLLDISGDGVMGYILIPKIGVKLSIAHGTAESVLQNMIGHLEGSSLPVGGDGTHTVLSGHTGLAHARLFTDLTELEEGDLFYLHILDETLAYKVDQIKIVEPYDLTDLKRVAGEDYCTLITCTPYGINSHRLLIRGVRTEYIAEVEQAQINDGPSGIQWFDKTNFEAGIITGGAVLAVVLIVVIISRRRRIKCQQERMPAGGKQEKRMKPIYWWQAENAIYWWETSC